MSTEDIKRKLTAIFSADVEGYSRLMEGDELATVQTLTSYKETMRKQIKHYRGRVVDSTGDNLLAEFPSVVDAVQCAVEVQQIIKGKNEDLPEMRIPTNPDTYSNNFRTPIPIHSGHLFQSKADTYSEAKRTPSNRSEATLNNL